FAPFGALASRARSIYDPKGDASLRELIQRIVADRCMVEPSRYLAELVATSGQPAYFYRFSYLTEAQRGRVPGATHGSEIPCALSAVESMLNPKVGGEDVEMGWTMSSYWTAFVKTGEPNGGGRPIWPRYDPASRDVLNFTPHGASVGTDPLKERLDLCR